MRGSASAADLRIALRQHLATPLSSGLAVALLAIAIAFLTTFLSFWSATSPASCPGFADARALVTVGQNNGRSLTTLSSLLVERMNSEVASLEGVAGTRKLEQSALDADDPTHEQRVQTELVTVRYFTLLRPTIQIGRGLEPRDHRPGAEPVVILSYRYWRRRFHGDPGAVGRKLRIRGPNAMVAGINPADTIQSYRIVGVMAPSVRGTFADGTQMWMPYEQAMTAFFAADPKQTYHRQPMLHGVGRLARGSTAEEAATEIRERYGRAGMELGLIPARPLDVVEGLFINIEARDALVRQVQLFLASGVLLALVAACNVSLFLLSRAPGRRRELGIRMAMGATPLRLAHQLAMEAALVVGAAALLGVFVSLWLTAAMRRLPFLNGELARPVALLDWRALAFVMIVALVLTALVSLAPIVRLRTLSAVSVGKAVTARAGWAQRLAATIQLAAAGVLASAALAFAWHLAELSAAVQSFKGRDVLVVVPRAERRAGNPFAGNVEALIAGRERLREIVESIPGVEQVGFGSSVPGSPSALFSVTFAGSIAGTLIGPDESVQVIVDTADAAYLRLLAMPILHGRAPRQSARNEVLVNETLARTLWGRTDIVDKTLPLPIALRVVGVVRDVAFGHPSEPISPRLFAPGLGAVSSNQILVKGGLGAGQLRAALQRLIDAGQLDFELSRVERVADLMSSELAPDRWRTFLALASTLLVVVLAAVGLYGTQRYLVGAGRRDFAVHAAIGAEPLDLARLVFRRGLLLAAPGLALMLPLCFLVVVQLRSGFGRSRVSPYPIEIAVGAGVVALVLAASFGPARLAALTQAAPLLREE